MSEKLRVLFLCTGNAARSQMAEALLRQLSNGQVEVFSAGSAPEAGVHPAARATLDDNTGSIPPDSGVASSFRTAAW